MKKLFIITFTLFSFSIAHAQSAASDALKLIYYLESDTAFLDDTEVYKILSHYTDLSVGSNITPDDVITEWDNYGRGAPNPFINEDLSIIKFHNRGFGISSTSNFSVPSFLSLGSAGGLDVTTFVDGLAKFLVKRFKEEVSADFLDRFKEELTTGDLKDVQALFPQTTATLTSLNFINYTAYVKALREAFYQDFRTLYARLPQFLERTDLLAGKPKLRSTLTAGFDVVSSIEAGQHPGEILTSLAGNSNIKDIDSTLQEVLKVADFVSHSMHAEGAEYWLDKASIEQIFNKDSHLAIYLGLLYQQLKKEDISVNGNSLRVALHGLAGTYEDTKPFFQGFGKRVSYVERAMKDLKEQKPEDRNFGSYYAYLNAILDLFKYSTDNTNLAKLNLSIPSGAERDIDKIFEITNSLNQLYLSAKEEEYQAFVLHLSQLFEETIGPDYPFKNTLLKYGVFMATVIDAEDSDQVAAAIEAIALPPGSYRVKRETNFSVDLNAFVGGFYAKENIFLTNTGTGEQTKHEDDVVGIASPVGLAISFGSPHKKCKSSFSFFISAIDIGAVTAYRFQDDTTKALPKINLENIFAPGAHLVWGIPKMSLSISAGIQMGPFLRELSVENSELTTEVKPNYRYGVSITSDIPLINFTTRNWKSNIAKRKKRKEERTAKRKIKKDKRSAKREARKNKKDGS